MTKEWLIDDAGIFDGGQAQMVEHEPEADTTSAGWIVDDLGILEAAPARATGFEEDVTLGEPISANFGEEPTQQALRPGETVTVRRDDLLPREGEVIDVGIPTSRTQRPWQDQVLTPAELRQGPLEPTALDLPKEMAGMVVRPIAQTLGAVGLGTGALLQRLAQEQEERAGMPTPLAQGAGTLGKLMRTGGEQWEQITQEMRTPHTNEVFDLGSSLALGGAGGALQHALMRKGLPAIAQGARALAASAGTGAVTAAAGDALIVNPITERLEDKLQSSKMSEPAKDFLRAVIPFAAGVVSAATLEQRLAKALGDPILSAQLDRAARSESPEEVMDILRRSGPASEWSPEISAKMSAKWRKWQEEAARRSQGGTEYDREAQQWLLRGEREQGQVGQTQEPGRAVQEPERGGGEVEAGGVFQTADQVNPKPATLFDRALVRQSKMPVVTPEDAQTKKTAVTRAIERIFPETVRSNALATMSVPGIAESAEVKETEDGRVYFEIDWDRVALYAAAGMLGATSAQRVGIMRRTKPHRPGGPGVYLRGGLVEDVQDFSEILAKGTTHIVPEWDGVRTYEEALQAADNFRYLHPNVTTERANVRYKTPNPETEARGNQKMMFPNWAFPRGRVTLDFEGCGRGEFARINGLAGEHPLGYRADLACYGGKCYAATLGKVHGKDIAEGLLKKPVQGAQRKQILDLIEKEGIEAAQKAHPDLLIAERPDGTISIARQERNVAGGGVGAKVSTNIPDLTGLDVRAGVDTDGSAYLSDVRVLDALYKANPRILTVFSSAYHTPPPPHALSDRTMINVTISGFFPLPEIIHRLRWAQEARNNGWNVILRYVSADPETFTKEEARLYNRIWEAVHNTDFGIMQQPLHRGSAMGKPIGTPHYPACCVGSARNPKTCDLCEVAEGLGREFLKFHRIWEEPDVEGEKILPGVPDYRAPTARTLGIPAEAAELPPSTSVRALTSHPDYHAAKKDGDIEAADRLVQAVLKPEAIEFARQRWGPDVTYVPISALEAGASKNAIPSQIATVLAAKSDARVLLGSQIPIQSDIVSHTGKGMWERLQRRPDFVEGEIRPGGRYVIVDDVITSGSTVAEMADYIRSRGGNVEGVFALANATRGSTLKADEATIAKLRDKGVAHAFFVETGIRPEAATRPEAEYMARFRDADAISERGSESVASGLHRILRTEEREDYYRERIRSAVRRSPNIRLHPATGIGAVAGIEEDEDGNVRVNPERAILGFLAGTVGIHSLSGLRAKTRSFQRAVWSKWDEKFADPIINFVKTATDRLVTNATLRKELGLGYDPRAKDLLREYERAVEVAWDRAQQIGRELLEIAPSPLMQKRLLQVLRGGITANEEWMRKAEQVRQKFDELRELAKEFQLLTYSRFDRLERDEIHRLTRIVRELDPKGMSTKDLLARAQELGVVDPSKKVSKARLVELVTKAQADAGRKLQNHYKVATKESYVPVMYRKWEGLTPKEREALEKEIADVHARMVRAEGPEREDLEVLYYQLKDVLDKQPKTVFSRSKLTMDLGWSHMRMDLPPEVQRMLGKIEQAAYPVAKGIGTQSADVIKAALFEEIAGNPDWAFKAAGDEVPDNYKVVRGKQWGALDGMAVRRVILEDLEQINDMRSHLVRLHDEIMGYWKFGKVVMNPATHTRNFLSNAILAYVNGDLAPSDIPTYAKAVKELRNKGRYYQEAKEWGLFRNSFASKEVAKLRDGLDELRNIEATGAAAKSQAPLSLKRRAGLAYERMERLVRDTLSKLADIYEVNEHFFKLAVYIRQREDGLDVDRAARVAEKALFNYGDIPPIVRKIKRFSPFFTFTYKAFGTFGEQAIRRPWRIGALMAALYGAEQYALESLGLSEAQHDELRRKMPKWQQMRLAGIGPHVQVLTPWRNRWGDILTLDLAYIIPYGAAGEVWGQSALPIRDIAVSHPLFDLLATLYTNRDPFSGRELIHEYADTAAEAWGKRLQYAWRNLVPELTPGARGWNKIMTGLRNTLGSGDPVLDWAGRPIELEQALLSTLLGIKLTPVQEHALDLQLKIVKKKIRNDFGMKRSEVQRRVARREMTLDEARSKLQELGELERKVLSKEIFGKEE